MFVLVFVFVFVFFVCVLCFCVCLFPHFWFPCHVTVSSPFPPLSSLLCNPVPHNKKDRCTLPPHFSLPLPLVQTRTARLKKIVASSLSLWCHSPCLFPSLPLACPPKPPHNLLPFPPTPFHSPSPLLYGANPYRTCPVYWFTINPPMSFLECNDPHGLQ